MYLKIRSFTITKEKRQNTPNLSEMGGMTHISHNEDISTIKGEASTSIYADLVNGKLYYVPNSKSLGKFG